MPTKAELAARIKEGARKRGEEQRRRQQLQREFLADLQGHSADGKQHGPSQYIACIFVTLLFLSFPLSERVVDWMLVGLFCALNALWVLVLRDPSDWLNILTMILSNLLLARWSPHIYELPAKLAAAPKGLLVSYVVGNAVMSLLVYFCYVQHNWFRAPPKSVSSSQTKRRLRSDAATTHVEQDELDLFVQQRQKDERAGWAVCALVACNLVALFATGVIPAEVLSRVAQGWMYVLQ